MEFIGFDECFKILNDNTNGVMALKLKNINGYLIFTGQIKNISKKLS